MKQNVKIAKQLIKIAKELVGITMTNKQFDEYSKEYDQQFGIKPNKYLFDIFKNKKKVLRFLKDKKRNFSNLKEYLSKDQIQQLLNHHMFCIVSAGRNEEQIQIYNNSDEESKKIQDKKLKQRYNELKSKLQSLNVPFYEVYGAYFGSHELSYIVDLTNNGKNNEQKINSLLLKIREFCLHNMKQDCIIEGVGNETVFQYLGEYREQIGQNDPYNNGGRSSIFSTPPKNIKYNNPNQSIPDISQSFSKEYDWNNTKPGYKYSKKNKE